MGGTYSTHKSDEKYTRSSIGSDLLITVIMMSIISWDLSPCSLVEVYRRLRHMYCFHLQGRKASLATSQSKQMALLGCRQGKALGSEGGKVMGSGYVGGGKSYAGLYWWKTLGNASVAERLAASRVGLSNIKLLTKGEGESEGGRWRWR
jgi:hypothetical protein